MMRMWDLVKWDFQRACYHEAGHLAVLRHFGGTGDATVHHPDFRGPRHNNIFTGQVRVFHPGATSGDPSAKRVFGMAGALAALLLGDPEMGEMDAEEQLENMRGGAFRN